MVEFNTSLDFLAPIFSIEGILDIVIAIAAAWLLYKLAAKYSQSAKAMTAKILPSFGFSGDEANLLSEIAEGIVKITGLAAVFLILGNYVYLLGPAKSIGSFISELIGYVIALALPLAIIYFARTWSKK